MNNITTQEDVTQQIYVTNNEVKSVKPVRDGGLTLGYITETVMTKEVFIECYNKWIMGER